MLDGAARTAQQAADELGVVVGQIAKSVIFKRKREDAAVLVVTSGDRRVDEKKVDALAGKIEPAPTRKFGESQTGFADRRRHARGPCQSAACHPDLGIPPAVQRFDVMWGSRWPPACACCQLSLARSASGSPNAPVVDIAEVVQEAV